MPDHTLVFTQPWWLIALCLGGAVLVTVRGLQGEARPGYLIGALALGYGAVNALTAYVQFDEFGASSRSSLIETRLAWRDIASVSIEHRTGKSGGTDVLSLKNASGNAVELVLNDVDQTREKALAALLKTKLAGVPGAQVLTVTEKLASR